MVEGNLGVKWGEGGLKKGTKFIWLYAAAITTVFVIQVWRFLLGSDYFYMQVL